MCASSEGRGGSLSSDARRDLNAPCVQNTSGSSEYWSCTLVPDGGNQSSPCFAERKVLCFVIRIDLPGWYGGRSPLKVMSNLICKAVFLTVFSAAYMSLRCPSQISCVFCSKAVFSGRKDRHFFILWPSIFIFPLCRFTKAYFSCINI